MTRKIAFIPSARRALKKLPKDVQVLLAARIESLADEPYTSDTEKIAEVEHCYRIRQGDYRLIYQTRDKDMLILVLAAGSRKEIYRHLIPALKQHIHRWEAGEK